MAPDRTTGRDPLQRREARFAKRRCALHPGGLLPGCQERRPRRDRNGRCKPGVFTHRTVATARNRASGFGGDWQVRQQLPVGVGPDDRMPPGSREPKVRRQTGQHCSSQNQSRKKKRIITGKVMSFLTTGHKQRKRRRRTGAAGARSSPFPKGNGLPGSLVVHARTMPARRKGPPANQQPLYKGASVQSDQHQP